MSRLGHPFVRLAHDVRCPAICLIALLSCVASPSWAQTGLPKLARGVLTVVPANVAEQDTVTGPRALPKLVEQSAPWTPHYSPISETLHEMAKHMTFRRAVWQFEFAAKSLRMTTVQTRIGGNTEQVRVWYLLYRLRNTGGHQRPVTQNGGRSFGVESYDQTLRFFPSFILRDHEHRLSYLDRILPAAVRRIHAIELRDPKVPLYDSVTISQVPIEVSTEQVDRSVWGVATWIGVDRRADFLSVFVQGLTNGYRWKDGPGGDREYLFKTLQLNYWRPGDAVHEHQGEFRVGLPTFQEGPELDRALKLYGTDERREYSWVYRP
jgi:hypothetical protein